MHHPLSNWQSVLEIFLAFDCLVVIIFNVVTIVQKKVYQSYSAFATLLCCSLLLTVRLISLLIYALARMTMEPNNFLFFACLNQDTSWYFTMNVELALVWQYWLIANILSPSKAIEDNPEGVAGKKQNRRLYESQGILAFIMVTDLVFIVAHYVFQAWTAHQVIIGDDVQQDQEWVIVRTCFKIIQELYQTFLIVFAIFVFYRVYKALAGVPGEESIRIRRQTKFFTVIYFSQVALRFTG